MERVVKLYVCENIDKEKNIRIVVDHFRWLDQQRPPGIAEEYGRYLQPGEQAHWQWESSHDEILAHYLEGLPRDYMTLKIRVEDVLGFLPKDSEEVRKAVIKELSDFLEKIVDEDVQEKPSIKEIRARLNKLV